MIFNFYNTFEISFSIKPFQFDFKPLVIICRVIRVYYSKKKSLIPLAYLQNYHQQAPLKHSNKYSKQL